MKSIIVCRQRPWWNREASNLLAWCRDKCSKSIERHGGDGEKACVGRWSGESKRRNGDTIRHCIWRGGEVKFHLFSGAHAAKAIINVNRRREINTPFIYGQQYDPEINYSSWPAHYRNHLSSHIEWYIYYVDDMKAIKAIESAIL